VPGERIQVSGIPIHPVFALTADRGRLQGKHGVSAAAPLLLVLCGGFGVGPVEALVRTLLASVGSAQMVIVAGRNEALRRRLERLTASARDRVRVLGFTTEMNEWMALADLAVTKPGGLTTSEALALGLPLVVANAIPGQETRNATMLFEEGAAVSGENPLTVGPRVARRLGRPEAARDVAAELGRLV